MSALWRGSRVAKLRIASGLVLFTHALLHFLNLGLVLVSVEAAAAMQAARQVVQLSAPGTVLLYGALLTHVALALARLVTLRRFRMPLAIWVQYLFGLAIPVLLIPHFTFVRGAQQGFDVDVEIGFIAGLIWGTPDGWRQGLLLLLVWIHGCIGLHMWLRLTRWWPRWEPVMAGLAVFVPTWALAGYVTEGRRISGLLADPAIAPAVREVYNWPDAAAFVSLMRLQDGTKMAFFAALGAAVLAWIIRRLLARRGTVRISYVGGPTVTTRRGPTLLEISRAHDVPHAALCGGRGRCSTCRVIVEEGADQLPPPSEAEARTLAAVNAPPGARLACQMRPAESLTVFRVFRNDGRRHRAHASQGEERRLAILFLDIRGFTARTAGQFPYDVVFLLNRFFDAIVPQITGCGGIVDKYLGDGLLAVFDGRDEATSARMALRAAEGIGSALATFNATLRAEGAAPVRIGIGLHLGDLVMGEIGAAGNAPRTIIGDTVNAASRLEGETKTLQVELLISGPLLRAAGHDTSGLPMVWLELRGRDAPLDALPVSRAERLDSALVQPGTAGAEMRE
ncbi:adenylate/guanylate cyclase domain-containing protein [Marinibacterium profundimaris]|uniref:adenylate/guanylate cyclase domain-containing protein n=1 Tax=Marinibacterium profundimaris TaxID=1679460 RepID=UPI000B527427|nr:adenylate/guanylate cyclase domain-containing protein [Marinibacterium profundimaris]